MRFAKAFLMGVGVLSLTAAVAGAGINRTSPGLPTVTNATYGNKALANNAVSVMCVECHTRVPGNPGSGMPSGSHFVTTADGSTNSGGGNTTSYSYGARNGAEYYRVTRWTFAGTPSHLGTFSKYGSFADNVSYTAALATDNIGIATTRTVSAANFQDLEMICESCHNITKNVQGGNNLVAPWTTDGTNTAAQVTAGIYASAESTLCIGCHGFMYTDNGASANPNQPNYADARNWIDASGSTVKRGNALAHYVNGSKSRQNHHVMTGDRIVPAQAAVGYLWRDTTEVDVGPSGWPAGYETMTTAAPGAQPYTMSNPGRGTMPLKATWTGNKVRPSTATNFSCVHCHSIHSGDDSMGASILIPASAALNGTAANETEKLGQGSRAWNSYSDQTYCYDCHTVATRQ